MWPNCVLFCRISISHKSLPISIFFYRGTEFWLYGNSITEPEIRDTFFTKQHSELVWLRETELLFFFYGFVTSIATANGSLLPLSISNEIFKLHPVCGVSSHVERNVLNLNQSIRTCIYARNNTHASVNLHVCLVRAPRTNQLISGTNGLSGALASPGQRCRRATTTASFTICMSIGSQIVLCIDLNSNRTA